MKPVEFEGMNVIFAEDQPEYQNLPANRTKDGIVTCCWELSDEELKTLIITKKIFVSILTFNQPLQPLLLLTENPLGNQGVINANSN